MVTVNPLSDRPDQCWESIATSKTVNSIAIPTEYPEQPPNSLRIVCLSDTHGKTSIPELNELLPKGDILIHAGDFTRAGSRQDIVEFNDNYLAKCKEQFKHVVVIAGNHEVSFDGENHGITGKMAKMFFGQSPFGTGPTPEESKNLLTNCTYLQDCSVDICGLKIYGSPWTPAHFNMGFNMPRGQALLDKWNQIPSDTNILITHGPPLGYGDLTAGGYHVGCAELLSSVQERVKPVLHIYGHIHEGHGIYSDGVTTFINASSCDKKYRLVNKPIVFDYPLS